MAINEITLESRIDNLLKTVFPTFNKVDVVHQSAFTLKFGHHIISIDGNSPKRNYARAISDVLIKVKDINTILLELKKEGLKINQDDIEQGLSYARLIHPMPPITLITNGKDHFFYDTYSKELIKNPPTDFEAIQNIIDSAFNLALADKKNVIDVLMHNDSEIVMQLLNNLSHEKFELLKGPVTNLTKPIAKEFIIDREIVDEIKETIKAKNVVGIIGSAFSGKTNILYQFFEKSSAADCGVLYIDCNDLNYSIFQQLANNFSKSLEFSVTKDQVRTWIIASLPKDKSSQMIVVFDNLSENINGELKSDLIELIDLFKGTHNTILFSSDVLSFTNIATVTNRSTNTIIGSVATTIEIHNLTNKEYEIACDKLRATNNALIQHGGHKTNEYREPRTLRYISAIYHNEEEIEENQVVMIPAIPDFSLINAITHSLFYTPSIRDLFKRYTEAFIKDESNRKSLPKLSIAASGNGAILLDTAKNTLGTDITQLLSSGIVTQREFSDTGQVLFPKTPELLSYYSIDLIKKKVESENNVDDAYTTFIDLCTPLPYNDIVGAEVLSRIARNENTNLFRSLVGKLLSDAPKKELIGKGTKVLGFFEDIGHITIDFNVNMNEGGFITNFLPYVILSQFVSQPFLLGTTEEEPDITPYLQLVREVGSNHTPMIRMYALPFRDMQSLSTHDFRKFGEFVSGTEGIIEPIVQSIYKVFHLAPEIIETLYKEAIRNNNLQLLWRIYLAIRNEINSTDTSIEEKAREFMKHFNEAFPNLFASVITQDIDDETEKERIQKLLSSKRSGKK